MKYVSIDIETTGLDSSIHQIIEFGAIIEDSNNPKSYEESKKYRRIVLARDKKYVFSSYAAKINASLIELISEIENTKTGVTFFNDSNLSQSALYSDELITDFRYWLIGMGFEVNFGSIVEIVAAGKNFASFDRKFIEATSRLSMESLGLRIHHRTIDPSTSFIDWTYDSTPPSTDLCKKRAELDGEVKHEALADAWDIIQLLRKKYNQKPYNSIGVNL
jgi:oligoribonuclease (3'-5' exoribonuclease)